MFHVALLLASYGSLYQLNFVAHTCWLKAWPSISIKKKKKRSNGSNSHNSKSGTDRQGKGGALIPKLLIMLQKWRAAFQRRPNQWERMYYSLMVTSLQCQGIKGKTPPVLHRHAFADLDRAELWLYAGWFWAVSWPWSSFVLKQSPVKWATACAWWR